MEKFTTAIIGGGASGLMLAARLKNTKGVVLFEKLDRVGKKLSATGNGQGNISNERVEDTPYFSVAGGQERAESIIRRYGKESFTQFLRDLGGLCLTDEKGRIYPASRQASSVTDLLRKEVAARGVDLRLSHSVEKLQKTDGGFLLTVKSGDTQSVCFAEKVVLCAGGKAAKNFGTDGFGHALAGMLGHTTTALYPSLVQIKTDTKWTKTLKGIRAQDCALTATWGGQSLSLTGDVIFTDYGLSGDAIFRLSAYIADKKNVRVVLDFAPTISEADLQAFLQKKRAEKGEEELLCGVVNNQIGRAIVRRAGEEGKPIATLVKAFDLPVTGSLGFDYAQVTKGGVPLCEVDDDLQSKKAKGLYMIGEVLDIDGPCGGFNLQWAYSSASLVAEKLER